MLIFNYLIVYGSTIQENCEERSSKGRCGGKVLPAAGDTGRQCDAGRHCLRDEREEFADAGRHPECIDQFCGGHDCNALQRAVGEHQELRRIQPVGAHGRRNGCKGVHRQEHQGGENQFPAFQYRKTGHHRHACRAED